jgi:quercetin dioxygenase-like cupin family protein
MTDTVNTPYTLIENLSDLMGAIKPDSIISRTFYKDGGLKAILFGFDTGQELSEHTSNQTAIIQIVQGDATVILGDDRHELKAGSWIHLPARLKHSIYAKTPLIMLLLMLSTESE